MNAAKLCVVVVSALVFSGCAWGHRWENASEGQQAQEVQCDDDSDAMFDGCGADPMEETQGDEGEGGDSQDDDQETDRVSAADGCDA